MKRLMQTCFSLYGILFLHTAMFAQNEQQTDKALEIFAQLQQTYQQVDGISFNVKYTYTNESKPETVLDSLSGKFEINKSNYHYLLDSTETIHNDKYTIILFREDKIMYLTNPSLAASANPVQTIGEFFKNNKDINCQIVTNTRTKTLSVHYPPGMQYKQINLTIDTVTGYLMKAEYIVQTKLLLETDLQNDKGSASAYDAYARVEADFFDYKQIPIDNSEFDERKFFDREGKNFKTTEEYKTYKIFIGSSNL